MDGEFRHNYDKFVVELQCVCTRARALCVCKQKHLISLEIVSTLLLHNLLDITMSPAEQCFNRLSNNNKYISRAL